MFIAFHTPAFGKHGTQAALGLCIARACGLAQQFKRHGAVLLHALAIQVHLPQQALRSHFTAARCFIEQTGGKVLVLGHALAVQMQVAQGVLSEAAVRSNRLTDQRQPGFELGRRAMAHQRQPETGLAFGIARGGSFAVPEQRLPRALRHGQARLIQVAHGAQRGAAAQGSRFAEQLQRLIEQAADQCHSALLKPLDGSGGRRFHPLRLRAAGLCRMCARQRH